MNKKLLESLEKTFNSSDHIIKAIINCCLIPEAKNNPEFEKCLMNEKKSVKDMLSKIKDWVKQSGNHVPSMNVVFSLAIHYFKEDDPQYVEELHQETPMEFGKYDKEFDSPIVKYITGTVIKEIVKEVKTTTTPAAFTEISDKVNKTVKKKLSNPDQLSIFDLNEDN